MAPSESVSVRVAAGAMGSCAFPEKLPTLSVEDNPRVSIGRVEGVVCSDTGYQLHRCVERTLWVDFESMSVFWSQTRRLSSFSDKKQRFLTNSQLRFLFSSVCAANHELFSFLTRYTEGK